MKFVWSSVIASSLAIPAVSSAVGLGPIQVHSGLNQPFNAQIELLSLKNVPLTGIKARLAGDQEFKQAGLNRPHILEQIKFTIEKSKQGKPVIHLTTDERMNEPYLKFLLDVAWSEGQFYREYTVLLDPPSYSVNTNVTPEPKTHKVAEHQDVPKVVVNAKVVDSPVAAKPVPETQVTTEVEPSQPAVPLKTVGPVKPLSANETPATSVIVPVESKKTVDTTYGPTSRRDDLFQIAVQFRPFAYVSLNQTMLAIKMLNPTAFNSDNVNSLKAGMTLKIPTPDIMAAIPADEAKAEIHRENELWFKHSAVAIAKPIAKPMAKPMVKPVVKPVAVAKHEIAKHEIAKAAPVPTVSHKDMIAHLLMSPNDMDVGLNIETSALMNPPDQETSHQANTMEKTLRTELAMTAEAVTAMKQANLDLQQQLIQLQEKNSELTRSMQAREQELTELRKTLALNTANTTVTTVPAVAPQAYSEEVSEHHNEGPSRNLIAAMALLFLSAGSVGLYFWFRHRLNQPVLWLKPEFDSESDTVVPFTQRSPNDDHLESDLEALSGEDLISSKLDLATAYIDMDDRVAARVLLDEVMTQGSWAQRQEAKKLLKKMA